MKGCHLEKWMIPGSVLYALLSSNLSVAQVVGDTTLPVGERSQVTGNPNFQIDGGATRGGNLFHSFQSFSVPTGGSVYFNNAADIQNIFSRVTGRSFSNIDGLIRANGTANLFLLNPNGIIFGRNASLNIGGSFVATTANAIGFGNGEFFSSNATQPLPSQLLTVNPNALFFNQQNPQPIINQSTFNNTGLQVPLRQNLMLVGGVVQLNNGWLISPGSYVEIGSVGGVGTVGLSTTGEDWQLNIPNRVTRADVSLSNGSDINVKGDGGSIRILGQNIDIDRSLLRIEIPSNSSLPDTQSGDLELNATNSIAMSNNSILANSLFGQGTMGSINLSAGDRISLDLSRVSNTLEQTGVGKVGDINITTGSLSLTGNAQLNSNTSGQGNAGSVNINARDTVSLDNSSAYNSGKGGDINVTTGSLSLTGFSGLRSIPAGGGISGNVNINARDTVSLDNSSASTASFSFSVSDAGDINITAGSLSLTTGASLYSSVSTGNSGSVNINVRDTVSLDNGSDILTAAGFGSRGNDISNGGDVNITAGSLSLTRVSSITSDTTAAERGNGGNVKIDARDTVSVDGGNFQSRISTGILTRAVGKGGDVTITTGSLFLINGGVVSTNNWNGKGNSGSVTIQARESVQIRGTTFDSRGGAGIPSEMSTLVFSEAVGNGGDVTITTGSLSVSDGGKIITNIGGQGKAGNIQIQARETVLLDRGYAISTLERSGVGSGGDIDITARSLSLLNGSQLTAITAGEGDAGNIRIATLDSVTLSGVNSFGEASGLFTTTERGATGIGGNIHVETGNLQVTNGAVLSARSLSNGRGGDITLGADTVGLSDGGQLLTTTSSSGRAGDIRVNTPELQLRGASSGLFAGTTSAGDAGDLTIQPWGKGQSVRVNLQDGAQISASTSGSGEGGTLRITAPESITLTGNGSVIAAGTGGSGAGGNLNLQTGTLNIQNRAQVTVSSEGTGRASSLEVDANRIFLDNQGSIRADTSGGGGNINLRSPLILLRNGSSITTNARGSDIRGGDISIDTDNLVAVPSENSDISANSANFRGGNVTIRASGIFGIEFQEQPTSLSGITVTGVSSELSGLKDIITLGIDPSRGLAELPTDVVDASDAIGTGCRDVRDSSFVVTGRGGLPPTPQQALGDDPRWRDWRTPALISHQPNATVNGILPPSSKPASIKSPLVEATGWVTLPDGQVILTASAPHVTSPNPWGQPVNCAGS